MPSYHTADVFRLSAALGQSPCRRRLFARRLRAFVAPCGVGWQTVAHRLGILVIALLAMSTAAAETFCVSTAQEFQNALTQAQGNAQNNEIRIESGTYSTANNGDPDLGFHYTNSMPGSLMISGGWPPNCIPNRIRPGAFETVLDGGNADRVLAISAGDANVEISITNLTIRSGIAPASNNQAGGLLIKGFGSNDDAGTVSIDRVVFTDNQANYASALSVDSYDRVDITNSLLHDNTVSISNTARVRRNTNSSQATYFINNTVVNNIRLGDNGTSGVLLSKSGPGGNVAANNVLWNNISWDIQFSGTSANQHLLYTTLQNVIGNAGTEVGTSSSDPMLESDFRLSEGSPAVDAGFEPAPGLPDPPPELDWMLESFDVLRFRRVSGPAVDRGAFELQDALFVDRFE